jgi:hypothetical protein
MGFKFPLITSGHRVFGIPHLYSHYSALPYQWFCEEEFKVVKVYIYGQPGNNLKKSLKCEGLWRLPLFCSPYVQHCPCIIMLIWRNIWTL